MKSRCCKTKCCNKKYRDKCVCCFKNVNPFPNIPLSILPPTGVPTSMCPNYDNILPQTQNSIHILNNCMFTLWALGTYSTVNDQIAIFKETLAPGGIFSYHVPTDTLPAGRVYFFYKNPESINGFSPQWNSIVPGSKVVVPTSFNQIVEMTLGQGIDNGNVYKFWDFDISYVDSASLPIYMWSPDAPETEACKKAFSRGSPFGFTDECPTTIVNRFSPGNLGEVGQCLGAYPFCANVNPASDFCKEFDNIFTLRGKTTAIYGGILGDLPNLTNFQIASFNRGLCRNIGPGYPNITDAQNPQSWYQQRPYNAYSKWIREKGQNYYGFSFDENFGFSGGGNIQCRSSRLNIVICPNCS